MPTGCYIRGKMDFSLPHAVFARAFRPFALLLLAAGYAGCGSGAGDATGVASEHEIIGGTRATGDPGVVAITRGGRPHCTGTVIAPRLILTAAHCVQSFGFETLEALFFASEVQKPGPRARQLRFAGAFVHQRYPEDRTADLALLELAEDAPVASVPILRTSLDARVVGQPLRVVGFGKTGPDAPAGTKMQGFARLLELEDNRLVHEANTCPGDSGGPGFLTLAGREVLVGVHSTGSCGQGEPSKKIRVDRHLDFVLSHPNAAPVPIAVPQKDPPPELPARVKMTLEGPRGANLTTAIRCAPGRKALSIELGSGLRAFFRFERPPTAALYDFDVLGASQVVTEDDGEPFVGGTWHVLVITRSDVSGAMLAVECL